MVNFYVREQVRWPVGTVLNPDGSITLVEYDPTGNHGGDWIEA